jgi:hypothetical protein
MNSKKVSEVTNLALQLSILIPIYQATTDFAIEPQLTHDIVLLCYLHTDFICKFFQESTPHELSYNSVICLSRFFLACLHNVAENF